jgi:hypothetical protein
MKLFLECPLSVASVCEAVPFASPRMYTPQIASRRITSRVQKQGVLNCAKKRQFLENGSVLITFQKYRETIALINTVWLMSSGI